VTVESAKFLPLPGFCSGEWQSGSASIVSEDTTLPSLSMHLSKSIEDKELTDRIKKKVRISGFNFRYLKHMIKVMVYLEISKKNQ
jgi:hypothetical protein